MLIIFVCTGNTCRSPMAMCYLNSLNIPNLTVKSRGLSADGSPAAENAIIAANEQGLDLSSHISQTLCKDDLSADLFICMSPSHLSFFLSSGIPKDKVILLKNGISDPYGCPLTVYRYCLLEICNAVDELVFSGTFTNFCVCEADYGDIKEIAKLEKAVFSEYWSENALIESKEAGTLFFAAKCGNELLGYIGISAIADEGYITNIAVYEKHRKKGVATLLLDRVFSLARQKALRFVSLEVRKTNYPAILLYEKAGFKTEGYRKNFYRNPQEDALIMTKRFSEDI